MLKGCQVQNAIAGSKLTVNLDPVLRCPPGPQVRNGLLGEVSWLAVAVGSFVVVQVAHGLDTRDHEAAMRQHLLVQSSGARASRRWWSARRRPVIRHREAILAAFSVRSMEEGMAR
jgi:hypothetical protein